MRQSERTDLFNEVQGRYYKVGSEIARLEQSIEHANELRERRITSYNVCYTKLLRIDAIEGERKEPFMLHYNFPPYCVGETGFIGSPKRLV